MGGGILTQGVSSSSSSSELSLQFHEDFFYLGILHLVCTFIGIKGYLPGWHHAEQLLIDQEC